MPGIGEPLIELRNVTVKRDGATILDNVSFTVHEGEIFGVVFVHGTGKSTLLRVAAGFFKPEVGEVLYRGRNMYDLSFKEEVAHQYKTGFVFQNGGLLVNTKVYDNVALPLRYHADLSEQEIEGAVISTLGMVGASKFATSFPYQLTVAKQKLVTLARALVRDPEIIFYDNFFKGADLVAWTTLTKIVRQLRATRNVAWVLMLEADPETYPIADRLCVVEDGRVLDTNAPEAIKRSKDVRVSRVFQALMLDDEEPGAGADTGTDTDTDTDTTGTKEG